MKRTIAVLLLASVTALPLGCSSRASKVSTTYVPSVRYYAATCEEIDTKLIEVGNKAAEVSGQVDSAVRKRNALIAVVSPIFLWPVLFSSSGDKVKEEQLAQLKGEHDALLKARKANGCEPLPQEGNVTAGNKTE